MSREEWRIVTIDLSPIEIIDGDRGRNYPKQEEFYDDEYCLFLNTSNVTSQGFNFQKTMFINSEKDQLLRKGKLKRYDIVLTTRGTVGNVAYYDENIPYENVRINSGMVIFRNSKPENISSKYFYQFLRSPLFHDQVESHSSGSAQPQLPIKDLKRIEFPLPPLTTQIRIATILSALDDKIELNRQSSATLEAIAQAIFKEWFVDFRYPGATGEMQDSKLGPTPKGWAVNTLEELTTKIGSGATPRGGSGVYLNEGVALIRSQNVYDSAFKWEGLARISGDAAAQLRNVEVEREDVLLNITGASILRTCVVDPEALPARVNQHVVIIRPRSGIPSRYIHLYLLQQKIKSYLMGLNAGASREAITKGHIEAVPVLHPPPDLLEAFEAVTTPVYSEIEQLCSQSRTLSLTRDTLLPKLISGEIEV